MHEDEAAFVAAICAAPADDTPRLVFADWLDERGGAMNQARAEFIRSQIELALNVPREVVIPAHINSLIRAGYRESDEVVERWRRFEQLEQRCRELLRGPRPALYEYEVIWFTSSDGTDTWRFLFQPQWRRGFVECVECTASNWCAHGDAIRAAHPVTHVRLTTWPRTDPDYQFADCPEDEDLVLRGDPQAVRVSPRMLSAAPPAESFEQRLMAARWPGTTFEFPAVNQQLYELAGEAAQGPTWAQRRFIAIGPRDEYRALAMHGLPRLRQPHPTRADLRVAGVTAARLPGGDWRLTVSYETPAAGEATQ